MEHHLCLTDTLAALLEHLLTVQMDTTGPDRLVREAAQGHTDIVREIIAKFPDKVKHHYFTVWGFLQSMAEDPLDRCYLDLLYFGK